ncbi:MAG TPA: site-specific integrase [Roseococcus sp.]|jgi:integrase|nr:site-specific integrase [Roseococcus sp.]
MAIRLYRRGEVWHARGTVRVGRETVHVPSFSTGSRARGDAEAVAAAEEARIRDATLAGPAGRTRGLTVADCILAYLARPRGVARLDAAKLAALNEVAGAYRLDQLGAAWTAWQRARPDHSPATATRYRALLLSAVRLACEAQGAPAPSLPAVEADRGERVSMLTAAERRRLLAAYSPHAACPALLLAHQGMRTQEALRLDWRDVDLEREDIRIGVRAGGHRTKSRKGRVVPMHPHVRMLLVGMWHAAGKPAAGPVFLSQRGEPYQDTTDKGGNPLRAAHATACRRARVTGFRVHDWRHDWAARMVMAGVDLFSLMRLGGWSSLAMVERYAAVTGDHLREAMRRLA